VETFRLPETFPRFLAEIRGKLSVKRKISIKIRTFSAQIHDPGEFSAANPKTLHGNQLPEPSPAALSSVPGLTGRCCGPEGRARGRRCACPRGGHPAVAMTTAGCPPRGLPLRVAEASGTIAPNVPDVTRTPELADPRPHRGTIDAAGAASDFPRCRRELAMASPRRGQCRDRERRLRRLGSRSESRIGRGRFAGW
jgi:hypothetical protein